MLSFDDTKIAFEYKSKKDLKKAFQLFTILKYPLIVSLGSSLTKLAIKLSLPINGLVKKFIFTQFCGGESVEDCSERILQLQQFNIGTILDYSVEGQEAIDDFEKNKNESLTIILSKLSEAEKIEFVITKDKYITATNQKKLKEAASYFK